VGQYYSRTVAVAQMAALVAASLLLGWTWFAGLLYILRLTNHVVSATVCSSQSMRSAGLAILAGVSYWYCCLRLLKSGCDN